MNLYGYGSGDPINNSDPFGLCPMSRTGIPCAVVFGAAGAAVGGTTGLIVGGTGGTLVAPGVGTVGGAVTGVAAGAELGLVVGAAIGATIDVAASINWGKVVRGIGLIGGILGGDAGMGLSKRLLDIEKARAAAAKTASDAEKDRKQREEEKKKGGAGGGGDPDPKSEPELLAEIESMLDLAGIEGVHILSSDVPCER